MVFIAAKAQQDNSTLLNVGDAAPAFACKTIDGKEFDLAKLRGKVVLLNFFATWCGPCNQELPVLQAKVWEKYKNNQGFVLLVIGREHSEKEVRSFAGSKKLIMPFAADPKREIYKLYATQNIPRNIVIGRDGKIIYQNMGYSADDFQQLETVIEKETGRKAN
jgi:peroxiredoxin